MTAQITSAQADLPGRRIPVSLSAPGTVGPLAVLRRRRPSSRLQIRGLPPSSRTRCAL
jgi:hypothetical protein